MIEAKIIKYLSEKMSVPIFAEYPTEKLEKFIIIEKTGSSISNHIKNATIAIQSYSTSSLVSSAELNEELKDVMNRFAECSDISKADLNSDYNYTDTSKKI